MMFKLKKLSKVFIKKFLLIKVFVCSEYSKMCLMLNVCFVDELKRIGQVLLRFCHV